MSEKPPLAGGDMEQLAEVGGIRVVDDRNLPVFQLLAGIDPELKGLFSHFLGIPDKTYTMVK